MKSWNMVFAVIKSEDPRLSTRCCSMLKIVSDVIFYDIKKQSDTTVQANKSNPIFRPPNVDILLSSGSVLSESLQVRRGKPAYFVDDIKRRASDRNRE